MESENESYSDRFNYCESNSDWSSISDNDIFDTFREKIYFGMQSKIKKLKKKIHILEKEKNIYFVTGNENKFIEVSRILAVNLKRKNIDLPEIQGSVHDIILDKCKTAVNIIGKKDLFVEDVSLFFNALNEFPGPYIKWALKSLGHDNLYKLLDGFEEKSAVAVCMYCFYNSKTDDYLVFEGKTKGIIVKPKGSLNFGWDAIFQPDGFNKTYAEMNLFEKDSISHRAKALTLMNEYITKEF
jgi:inosine triphosphate pyrophosphatase